MIIKPDEAAYFDMHNLLGRYKNILYQRTVANNGPGYSKTRIIEQAKELFLSARVLGSPENKNRALLSLPDETVLSALPSYTIGMLTFPTNQLFLDFIHEYGGYLPCYEGVLNVFAHSEEAHTFSDTVMKGLLRKFAIGTGFDPKEYLKASIVFYDFTEKDMNGLYTLIYDYSIPPMSVFSKEVDGHTSYYANGFSGLSVLPLTPPDQDSIDLLAFLANHINTVICNSDPHSMYCIWCFLADMFQHPADRPAYALVIQGDKGNGKSQIFDVLLRNVIGGGHFHVQAAKEFTKWNKNIVQSLFTNIDEWVTSDEMQTDLRTLITAKEPTVREKNEKERRVRTYSRIVITCNNDAHIVMEPAERRFNLMQTNNDIIALKYPANSTLQNLCVEYMELLDQAVSTVGPYFLDLLLHIDTSGWNRNLFVKTDAAIAEQSNVRPMFHDFMVEEIDNAGTSNSCMSRYDDFMREHEADYSRGVMDDIEGLKDNGGHFFFLARDLFERYSRKNQRATVRSMNHDLHMLMGNGLLQMYFSHKAKDNKVVRDTLYALTKNAVSQFSGKGAHTMLKPPPLDMSKLPIFDKLSDTMRERLALYAKITTAAGRNELSRLDEDGPVPQDTNVYTDEIPF